MSDHIPSYPKVYNIGHPGLADLFANPETLVTVEEKLDGSQISFGVDHEMGILTIRSKNAHINPFDPPKLFGLAVRSIVEKHEAGLLPRGVVFRGEAICSRRHNRLQYDRFPEEGVVLFDAEITDLEGMVRHAQRPELEELGQGIGMEVVKAHAVMSLQELLGEDMNAALQRLLGIPSMLGGKFSEGVVIKAHSLFGLDGKFLAGKYVRPEFRELNNETWKVGARGVGLGWENPFSAAVLTRVNRAARWEKALQALRERGVLQGEMRDIPALMEEISRDGHEELMPVIEEMARKAWKSVGKGLTRGMPEWYKERLVQEQAEAYAASLAPASPAVPEEEALGNPTEGNDMAPLPSDVT